MENVLFEAIPDLTETTLKLRLCRIRILDVGSGLPCIHLSNPKSKEIYSKTQETLAYSNVGSLDIGTLCPVNYLNGGARSNKFLAQVIYDIPREQVVTGAPTEVTISSGVKEGETSIHVASQTYDFSTAPPDEIGVENCKIDIVLF